MIGQSNTYYKVGDVVKYGGYLYCKKRTYQQTQLQKDEFNARD